MAARSKKGRQNRSKKLAKQTKRKLPRCKACDKPIRIPKGGAPEPAFAATTGANTAR